MLHEGGNVLSVSRVRRGDAAAAIAGAAHVVSQRFRTQRIEHAFLEPESSLALPEDGGSHVYSQGQGVWDDRRQVASYLGLPDEQVRVTQVATGGAFGAKEDVGAPVPLGAARAVTGQPVRITLTRAESLRFHSKRHPMWLDYRVGCDEEGTARRRPRAHHRRHGRLRQRRRQGARAGRRPRVRRRTASRTSTSRRSRSTRTTRPRGAMRGFGVNQTSFAIEGVPRHAGREGRPRRLGDALAQRARRGRPLLDRPAARRGRRPEADAARGARRLRRRALRGHRLRRQEHRDRQRDDRVRPRDPAARARRQRDPLPLLDGDGPGREHGARADRLHRARPRPRPGPRRRRHRARSRDRSDDRLARDRARRQRGDRRRAEAGGGLRRAAARRARRAGVRGRVRLRLDDGPRRRRAGHAHGLQLGDAGGGPRRRGPAREGGRRPRRRQGAQPAARRGPDRGRASTWASARRSRRTSSSRTACR